MRIDIVRQFVTVSELARADGITDAAMIAKLQKLGFPVTSVNERFDRQFMLVVLGLEDDTLEQQEVEFTPKNIRRQHVAERSHLPPDIINRLALRLKTLANLARAELSRRSPRDGPRTTFSFRVRRGSDAYQRVVSLQNYQDLGALLDAVGDYLQAVESLGLPSDSYFRELGEARKLIFVREPEVIYEHRDDLVLTPALIETVSDSLLALLAREPRLLFDVSPRKFEEIIAELFSREGFEVQLTKATRDGGKDIIAISRRMDIVTKLIVECKRYREDRKVDLSLVHRLLGVKVATTASKAILATTSTFTRDARSFANDHFWDIELKDLEDIRRWLKPYA